METFINGKLVVSRNFKLKNKSVTTDPDYEWKVACRKLYMRNWNITNYERRKLKQKEYQSKNKERYNTLKKIRLSDPVAKARYNRVRSENKKQRWKTEPHYRFVCNMRRIIRRSFQRCKQNKCDKTINILGCTPDEFKLYISSMFLPGMTWENYGKVWHIDHRIPLDLARKINVTDELVNHHVFELSHYLNLQPMFALDNFKKSNKL